MPVTVVIHIEQPTQQLNDQVHEFIIPDATPSNDGVMTAAQAAKLAGISPSDFDDLQQAYNGGGPGPQLINLDPVRLGIIVQDTPGGLGPGVPLFSVRDSTGATLFLDVTDTVVTIGENLLVGGNVTPTASLAFSLGDPVTPFLWAVVASPLFNSAFRPMGFVSAAFTGGVNPIYTWDANGDIEANLFGPVYRFRVGNEPHDFIDFVDMATGAQIQGYQTGLARGSITFNNLGVTIDGPAGAYNLIPANDNAQSLGGVSNRWATVYATAFDSRASEMSFLSSLAGGATPAFHWVASDAGWVGHFPYVLTIGAADVFSFGLVTGSPSFVSQIKTPGALIFATDGGVGTLAYSAANGLRTGDGGPLGGPLAKWGGLYNAGILSAQYRTGPAPIGITATGDYFVGVSGAGARTVNLPAANTCIPGQFYYVQEVGNSAGAISINPFGADTINGVNATVSIAAAFGSRVFHTDGISAWFASNTF